MSSVSSENYTTVRFMKTVPTALGQVSEAEFR
jgi:hypothetical protein